MVIKVDKSEEFIKSGKKLISEYDSEGLLNKIKKKIDGEFHEIETTPDDYIQKKLRDRWAE